MTTYWMIWTPKRWSTTWLTPLQLQTEAVDDTLSDLEADEAQLDTVAEKLAEVKDVTQTDALVVALTAKLAEVYTKALVNTVANTVPKVKAVTFGDTLVDLKAEATNWAI